MEKQKDLRSSIDELRKHKGLEHLSDKEAEEAILAIEKLTALIIKILRREELDREKLKAEKRK